MKDFLNRFIFNRFFLFVLLLVITFCFSFLLTGSFIPANESQNLWFYSGLLMVLISSFFIEEYYTSPRNILANNLPLIVIFVAVKEIFYAKNHMWLWWAGFAYIILIVFISVISIVLSDSDKSVDCFRNKFSNILKDVATTFGKGKFVFSGMFLYFLFAFYKINDIKVLSLMVFWWILVTTEPHKLVIKLKTKGKQPVNAIGHIISVQSKRIGIATVFWTVD